MTTVRYLQPRSSRGRRTAITARLAALAAAAFSIYSAPALSIWGGQEYIAVPNVSNYVGGKTIIKRWYAINKGRPVTDSQGVSYQFGTYLVKDTYYLDTKSSTVVLKRVSTVDIQLSGTQTGAVSLTENSVYRQTPGSALRQIKTVQNLAQTLVSGKETGNARQTLTFKYGSASTPPPYPLLNLLPIGTSFSASAEPGRPTQASVSGSLCLSSQPNQPCPTLPTQSISFSKPLGWTVQGSLDSLTVRAGTYSNITVVEQHEPLLFLQYTTACPAGSPSSGCLVLGVKKTGSATSWASPTAGVIQYKGPFYVNGVTVSYELKRIKPN